MNAVVNENAAGATRRLIGQELEIVGPGANEKHLLVRHPGERKVFGFPAAWVDLPEPDRCPTCGRALERGRG